jgi:hypothetical protein
MSNIRPPRGKRQTGGRDVSGILLSLLALSITILRQRPFILLGAKAFTDDPQVCESSHAGGRTSFSGFFTMHRSVAFLFDGELIIPMFIAALLVALVGLTALAYLLVRLSRRKLGKRSLFLAPLPFVIAVIGVPLWIRSQAPNSGPPRALPGAAVNGIVRRLPDYASFSLTGAAYFDNRLYVGSNVGLLEIQNGAVARLFQAQKSDSVVSGPWFDRSDHLLWVMDEHTHELLNFNGSSWQRIAMPQPPKGYYSRGEVLEGAKPVGTDAGFWISAAGGAWRWNAKTNNWTAEPVPPLMSVDDSVLGALPIQGGMAYIVRHELLPFLIQPGQQFKSDTITLVNSSGPHELPVKEGISFLAEIWTVANASGYICDRDGGILIVSPSEFAPIPAPGACEAVAVDEQGNLVASFRGHGIFRFVGSEWRLLSPSMPHSGQGEYWAYLAISNAEAAYVTDAKPVVDKQRSRGTDMHWKRNAETAAWIIRGGQASKVKLN